MSSEVNVSSQKFNIKLFVPEADSMTELWLRLESVCIVLRAYFDCCVFLLLAKFSSGAEGIA